MSLRKQLLLISLLVLVLPLGAWQFARQIEQTLRDGHAQGLIDVARGAASQLAIDDTQSWPTSTGSVLYVNRSSRPPFLDGYADDWQVFLEQAHRYHSADQRLRVQFAALDHASGLYLLFHVQNDQQVFATPGGAPGDHLVLSLEHPDGTVSSVTIAPLAPGWIETRGRGPSGWPRVQGFWQSRGNGWTLELQLPDDVRPQALAFVIHDKDRSGQQDSARQAGTTDGTSTMISRQSAMDRQLERLTPAGTRSWAVLDSGWVLGHADRQRDWLPAEQDDSHQASWLGTLLFERLLSGRLPTRQTRHAGTARLVGPALEHDQPTADWSVRADDPGIVLTVSVPVFTNGQRLGTVVFERDADALLMASNRAVLRLLAISLGTLSVMALILLGFATLLSERIRNLRDAAEQAVGSDGRVRQVLPAPRAGDEIGDLGRSVSSLLGRLREHQVYLRTLADKLAHELRTPLAMIRSSLENLEHATDPEDIARYCHRANEGSARLNRIFQAMSQAARIEESIQEERRETFDLGLLLVEYTSACRQTYGDRRFVLNLDEGKPILINGSADLFAQLLDKLIDNAVDFSPSDGTIEIRVRTSASTAVLEIDNDGPGLPGSIADNLFDSMVSARSNKGDQVHLGLGLSVARLITEFHHGSIRAANSRRGCCISLTIPLDQRSAKG
jgi:two-component system, OmpR family, sensor histidine kinase ChvG